MLAVVCIGGVELAACRFFAPDTYERIVAPVRYAAGVAADTGKAAAHAVGDWCQAAAGQVMQAAHAAAEAASDTAQKAAAAWDRMVSGPAEIVLELDEPEPDEAVPATDPPLTGLREANGRQILTGGSLDVVYYCQSDEEWADQMYGTDPIGPYGCGPTAMAIVVASMTETDTDPAKMSAWAADHGYWAKGSGSYHSIVRGISADFGLLAEPVTEHTVEQLCQELSSGRLMVALMTKGHFTKGGHFIVLRGITLSGEVLVADPNSLENSLTLWDPQLILDELSSARDNGAPLWAISVAEWE